MVFLFFMVIVGNEIIIKLLVNVVYWVVYYFG